MKKVLSLLLVCTMIFSLAAFSVNADGTDGYKISAAVVGAVKSGRYFVTDYSVADSSATYPTGLNFDSTWTNYKEQTVFALAVSATAVAGGGHFVLNYDSSVVTPAVVAAAAATGDLEGQVYNDLDTSASKATDCIVMMDVTGPQGTDTTSNAGSEVLDGKIAMTWMSGANSGGVNANEVIAYITFFVNEGKTTADFNASTFTFADDCTGVSDSTITAAAKASYGALYLGTTAGDLSAVAGNIVTTHADIFTYPNSNKTVGEDKWVQDTESTVGTVTFPTTLVEGAVTETATSGARTQIAVFGKNVTGHELADGDYWVQFNENKYLGKASTGVVTAWSIVIVDTTGEKMEAGRTYSYTAGCGEQQWTGTVTVAQIAE